MIDLFSDAGRAALERIARQATLYAFDFDGTLAPIVGRPDDAAAPASTVALLGRLGAMVPTAILTGRGVDDIRQRLEFTPLHLIGNHGAEGLPDALHPSLAASLSACGGNAAHHDVVQAWLAQWPDAIAAHSHDPGVVVEAKAYSLSVHYRHAANADAAIAAIDVAIARLRPSPRVIGGKCVVNLLPEGAPDKGRALTSLVRFEHCDAAFFIGDDLTDEAAFHGAPESWLTVRVGHDETSAARYFVAEQAEVDRCIALLVANAEASGAARG